MTAAALPDFDAVNMSARDTAWTVPVEGEKFRKRRMAGLLLTAGANNRGTKERPYTATRQPWNVYADVADATNPSGRRTHTIQGIAESPETCMVAAELAAAEWLAAGGEVLR